MESKVTLPITNENGYYEIRLESIGGLGANLCGKMLGELGAIYMKLNAASFSSYGSEKRGSPVKAFIRYSALDNEIGINSPVEKPHILGLFHEAMIGKSAVTAGVDENTQIVINTTASPEEIREKIKLYAGTIHCIDALRIAMEEKSRINMVMLGAVAKVSGFIPLEAVEEIVKETVGKKYPAMLEANLSGVRRGYAEMVSQHFAASDQGKILQSDKQNAIESKIDHDKELEYKEQETYAYVEYEDVKSQWGYANAPIGGVNPCTGSTVSNDLSASREGYIPLFIKERCINCGLCDSTCPDMVFQFEMGEYKGKKMMVNQGLDYHHCKGCLRCVAVCPVNALVQGVEKEHPNPEFSMKNKDLLPEEMEYEEVGPNSYVTSESYLTEERVDGGLV